MCAVAHMGGVFSRDWKPTQHRRSGQKIVLNAGENATEFYDKHGHAVVDEGQNAFRRDLPCSYGELVVIKPASLWFELLVTPTW
jgi:hypothetical protein